MTAAVRAQINQANAAQSTGPKTAAGKQRASMNAFQHGLTGQNMLLQTHEHEAYARLTEALTAELAPATETERQLVQRIIDCHTRLNRIAALESNILNFGLVEQTTDTPHDDATECMAAQSRSWLQHENSFEKLGRYEARLSRQLLAYTKELERLQAARRENEAWTRMAAHRLPSQTLDPTPATSNLASFRQPDFKPLQPNEAPLQTAAQPSLQPPDTIPAAA